MPATPDELRALREDYATAPAEATPANAPAAVPASLPDRYTKAREIARGGMGRVVEAHDRVLRRDVAIKLVLASDAGARRRFAREMRITAQLEHPSIVPIHDAGVTDDGTPFYVMRKVGGQPLDRLLAPMRTLRERLELVPRIVEAAVAVGHAHERGIIHRDLKPQNILVDASQTTVIDWGLAKVIAEDDDAPGSGDDDAAASLRTRAGSVLGTPGFMSPEQIRGEPVGTRGDVYALGATLYHVLANEPPHAAASGTETMEAALARPATPIAEKVPGVPPKLAAIVDRALAHDAADRFPDATAVADALRALDRRPRRSRARLAAALALALAAVATVIYFAWPRSQPLAAPEDRVAVPADAGATGEVDRELAFTRARALVDKEPAAAVALVRPYASGERWREVRAIAASARAAGVPWRLGDRTIAEALSPDGRHLATQSANHDIGLWDVETREHRVLLRPGARSDAPGGGPRRLEFADATQLIVVGASQLLRVDTATGATTEVALALELASAHVAIQGDTLFLVDGRGGAWRVPPRATTAEKLAIPDHVHAVAANTRGDRAAFGGDKGVWLVERGEVVRLNTDPHVRHLAFAPDGDELIAKAGNWFTVWTPTRHIVPDPHAAFGHPAPGGSAAYAGRTQLTVDPSHGLRRTFRPLAPQSLAIDHAAARPLFAVGDDLAAVVLRDGVLFLHEDRQTRIAAPDGACRFTGAARSYTLVASCRTGLFVWDLAPILPRRLRVASFLSTAAATGSAVLLLSPDGAVQRADVASRSVGAWPRAPTTDRMMRWRAVAPSGEHAIAVRETTRLSRISRDAAPLHFDREIDAMVAGDRLLVGTERGVLERRALDGGDPVALHERAASFARVSVAGTWAYGVWRDLHMVRIDLTTNAQTTATSGDSPTPIASDGSVWWYEGAKIIRWPAEDKPRTVATTDQPIERLRLVDGRRVIAIVDDGTGYLVDASGALSPLGRSGHELADPRGDRVVMTLREASGQASGRVVDVEAALGWPIAATTTGALVSTADGRWVVTTPRGTTDWLEAWPVDVPGSAAEMPAWLGRLTNAAYDVRRGVVSWR